MHKGFLCAAVTPFQQGLKQLRGLKAPGILHYCHVLKLRRLGPCCGAMGKHLLAGEERRVLGKGGPLGINGEKAVTRLDVAEGIRDSWAERLRLLFTPLCF